MAIDTNRLQAAKDFSSNTLGSISGAIKSPVKSIQDIAGGMSNVVNTPSVKESTPQPQIQQSQAGSTIAEPALIGNISQPVGLQEPMMSIDNGAVPMPTSIPATGIGNNMFAEAIGQDTIANMRDDVQNETPIEEIQKKYPQIPSDKIGEVAADIWDGIPYEELSKKYDFLEKDNIVPQTSGSLKGQASKSTVPFIGEKANDWMDKANIGGWLAEKLDNVVAQIPVTDLGRGAREKALTGRLASLDQTFINKKTEKFYNLSPAMQAYYGSPEGFIKQSQLDLIDQILGVGEKGPNVAIQLANIPGSLAKFVSGTVRAATNPLDTLVGMVDFIGQRGYEAVSTTKDLISGDKTFGDVGDDVSKYIQRRMEYDPVGLSSDILMVTDLAGASGKFMRGTAKGAEMLGAKKLGTELRLTEKLYNDLGTNKGLKGTSGGGLDNVINRAINTNAGALKESMIKSRKDGTLKGKAYALGKGVGTVLLDAQQPITALTREGGRMATASIDKVSGLLVPDDQIKERFKNTIGARTLLDDYENRRQADGDDFDFNKMVNDTLEGSLNNQIELLKLQVDEKRALSPAYENMKMMALPIDPTPIKIGLYDDILGNADNYATLEGNTIKYGSNSRISETERAGISKAVEIINEQGPKDARWLINARQNISDYVDFNGNSTPTLRKIYDRIDAQAKSSIPFFNEVTAMYRDKIAQIQPLQKLLTVKDGEPRTSLHSALLNIDSPAKIELKKQLLEHAPGLVDTAHSLKLIKEIHNLRTSTKGLNFAASFIKTVMMVTGYQWFGGFLGGALGYALADVVKDMPIDMLKEMRYEHILKKIQEMPDDQKNFVTEVGYKISQQEALTKLEEVKMKEIMNSLLKSKEIINSIYKK